MFRIEILQVIVALGLINVWILRNQMATDYRGGNANSLQQEFATYGLPSWMYYLVGALKLGSAAALIAGLWQQSLALYAAGVVSFLMVGALMMHIKIKDPIKKSLPALSMLLMSLGIVASSLSLI